MPRQNRKFGKKGESVAAKPAIKIAKPEMTMTGFEHSKKTLRTKERLRRKQEVQDGKSSSRRSRSHASERDLRNPDSTSDEVSSGFGINKADAPPMNQEIRDGDDHMDEDMMGSIDNKTECETPECERAVGKVDDPKLLNPKNYAFLPSCYTQQIRPAGKFTQKSAAIKEVFSS